MKRIVLNSFIILSFTTLSLNAVKETFNLTSENLALRQPETEVIIYTPKSLLSIKSYNNAIDRVTADAYRDQLTKDAEQISEQILVQIRNTTDKAEIRQLVLSYLQLPTCDIPQYEKIINTQYPLNELPENRISTLIATKLSKIMFPHELNCTSIGFTIEVLQELARKEIEPWKKQFLTCLKKKLENRQKFRKRLQHIEQAPQRNSNSTMLESTPTNEGATPPFWFKLRPPSDPIDPSTIQNMDSFLEEIKQKLLTSDQAPYFQSTKIVGRKTPLTVDSYKNATQKLISKHCNRTLDKEIITILDKICISTDISEIQRLVLSCLQLPTCDIPQYEKIINTQYPLNELPENRISKLIAIKLSKIMFPKESEYMTLDYLLEALKELLRENSSIEPWKKQFLICLREKLETVRRTKLEKQKYISVLQWQKDASTQSSPIDFSILGLLGNNPNPPKKQKTVHFSFETAAVKNNYQESITHLTLGLLENYNKREDCDAEMVNTIFQELTNVIDLKNRLAQNSDSMEVVSHIFEELSFIFKELKARPDLDLTGLQNSPEILSWKQLTTDAKLLTPDISDEDALAVMTTLCKQLIFISLCK